MCVYFLTRVLRCLRTSCVSDAFIWFSTFNQYCTYLPLPKWPFPLTECITQCILRELHGNFCRHRQITTGNCRLGCLNVYTADPWDLTNWLFYRGGLLIQIILKLVVLYIHDIVYVQMKQYELHLMWQYAYNQSFAEMGN